VELFDLPQRYAATGVAATGERLDDPGDREPSERVTDRCATHREPIRKLALDQAVRSVQRAAWQELVAKAGVGELAQGRGSLQLVERAVGPFAHRHPPGP
jgi:hypothetical protein